MDGEREQVVRKTYYREKEAMNRDKGGRNGGTKGKGKSAGEDEILRGMRLQCKKARRLFIVFLNNGKDPEHFEKIFDGLYLQME